jgi:hypothetical protein
MQGQIIFNNQVQNNTQSFGNHQRLEEMIKKSHSVLMCVKSVFPFELFPDVLTIDENKITLSCREFAYENIHSVLIEDITFVTVDMAILHATLNITDSTGERFPVELSIHNLKKEEAEKARCLIQGLVAAKKLNIDFNAFGREELVEKLIKLGEVSVQNSPK